jgi:hypothetical protein
LFLLIWVTSLNYQREDSSQGAGRGKKILLFQQNGVGFFANHDSPLRDIKTDDEWNEYGRI